MPSVMPSQHHSPHPHAQTAPSDLQLLDYLSSTPAAPKRKLARREQPLDPLLFTAVLAGSGQITRHHIGHGLGTLRVVGRQTAVADSVSTNGNAPRVLCVMRRLAPNDSFAETQCAGTSTGHDEPAGSTK
jgi:hypothetical protein